MSGAIVPALMTAVLLWGTVKKKDVSSCFAEGAQENLRTAVSLVPTLVLMMTAVGMFTASGAAELMAGALSPLLRRIGFPPECLPAALVRPISGSGALAAAEGVISQNGADSFAGRVTAVMMSSTETTLYTISIYYAAVKRRPPARVFIAAAFADLTGMLLSPLAVRMFLGE